MSRAEELGMSRDEYEEAVNLEKVYFLANKCDRCKNCGRGGISHVDCTHYEFLCGNCAAGKSGCKRIGDDKFKTYEVQKLERKYGDNKKSSAPPRPRSSPPSSVRTSHRDRSPKMRREKSPRRQRAASPSSSSSSSGSESSDDDEPTPPPRSRSQPRQKPKQSQKNRSHSQGHSPRQNQAGNDSSVAGSNGFADFGDFSSGMSAAKGGMGSNMGMNNMPGMAGMLGGNMGMGHSPQPHNSVMQQRSPMMGPSGMQNAPGMQGMHQPMQGGMQNYGGMNNSLGGMQQQQQQQQAMGQNGMGGGMRFGGQGAGQFNNLQAQQHGQMGIRPNNMYQMNSFNGGMNNASSIQQQQQLLMQGQKMRNPNPFSSAVGGPFSGGAGAGRGNPFMSVQPGMMGSAGAGGVGGMQNNQMMLQQQGQFGGGMMGGSAMQNNSLSGMASNPFASGSGAGVNTSMHQRPASVPMSIGGANNPFQSTMW